MRSHGVLVLMVFFGYCSAGYRGYSQRTTPDPIQGQGNSQQTGQNGNQQPIDTSGVGHENPTDPFQNYQPKETNGNPPPISVDPYYNRQGTYGVYESISRYGDRLKIDQNGNFQQIDRYGNRMQIDQNGRVMQIDRYGNRQLIDPQGSIQLIDQYGNRVTIPYGNNQQGYPYGNNQPIRPNGGNQQTDPNGNNKQIYSNENNEQIYPNGNNQYPIDYTGNGQQTNPYGNSHKNPIDYSGNGQQINPNENSHQNPIDYSGNGQQTYSNGNNEQTYPNGNNQNPIDYSGNVQQINPYGNSHQNPIDYSGNGQRQDQNGNNDQIDPNGHDDVQIYVLEKNPQIDSNGNNQQTNPNGNRRPSSTDYDKNYQQTESDLCFVGNRIWGRCVKTTLCQLQSPKYDPATGFIFKMGSMIGDDDDQSQRDLEQCGFLKMCCPLDKINPTPVKPSVGPTPGCGYSNPGGAVFQSVFREKGGSAPTNHGYADFAEFPWMVALLKAQATGFTGGGYIGGGTLIHPSVVMTAAHKVDTLRPSEVKCRAGEWNTLNKDEAFEHQERAVRSIAVHEQFNRLHSRFDIALLFTETPFTVEAHVNVACLSRALPPPGTVCYSMGWGEDLTKGTHYAVLLKKIPLPLVTREACETKGKSILGETYSLHRTLTCAAGTEQLDTCIGDGGSPLVCPIGDPKDLRYGVVGIVAYGFVQCGEADAPGVYVNVPELYPWVDSQVEMEGITNKTYVVTRGL